MQTVEPVVSGNSSSSAAISKDTVVTANNTSLVVKPGSLRMLSRKFTNAR